MTFPHARRIGHRLAVLTLIAPLAGCGAVNAVADAILPDFTEAEFARAGFADTGFSGSVSRELTNVTEEVVFSGTGAGYAYKGGFDANGDYLTLVGSNNLDRLPNPTFPGTATFTGEARGIYANVNRVLARNSVEELSAPVTVTANLGTGIFTGATNMATTNSTLDLNFTGAVVNGNMTGTGQFRDGGNVTINTDLQGRMSDNTTVLIFQGGSNTVAVAGGIIATR